MKKIIRLLVFSFVILSCQDTNKWYELEVGNTIKVSSIKGKDLSNNYSYKWSVPLRYPSNNADFSITPEYEFKGNSFYFTPKYSDSYIVFLEITDKNDSIVHKENFLFNATANKLKIVQNNTELNNNIENKDTLINNEITKEIDDTEKRYTIQIAVWKTKEKAVADKSYLKELGYDAYVEESFLDNANQIVYRVRVGSFSSKALAEEIRDELLKKETKWGKELWIANTK